MRDMVTGVEHIQPVPDVHALWSVLFTNGTEACQLSSMWFPYATATVTRTWRGTQRARFRWDDLRLGTNDTQCAVEVTVELPRDSGIASFKISVKNESHTWGLVHVDFPDVTGFLKGGAYDLAGTFGHAESWGALYRNYTGCLELDYPDGWRGTSMQFACASRDKSSVYMAAHDSRAWHKTFLVEPGVEYFIRTYAENSGVPGSGYAAPYPAMLGVYQGDWLAGCKIYRRFAVTAPWTSMGKVSRGKASLPAARKIGLWMREWGWTKDSAGDYAGSYRKMIGQAEEARDYFGVPLGFHWYNWQEADFDTKYPHFFPAKAGVGPLAKGMVDMGLAVMPYINARIVDQSNADFPALVPYAAKRNLQGRLYSERYGNRVKQAAMCPSTRFWQDTIASNVQNLVTGLGVNAVYIDQIAAAPPCLCFDKAHGHPLGGGSWWVDGYRQMLRKIRSIARSSGRNVIITSECTAEPFMDGLDAFLVVTERSQRSIPMLPAVYAGYTLYFGSEEGALDRLTDEQFMMEMGRDFLWGDQNGWFGFSLFRPENAQKKAYLRTLAQARVAGLKYLAEGELVGLFDDGSESGYQAVPYVQGSIWKAEDGSLGLVIANYRNQNSTLAYALDPRTYGLRANAGYRCARIHPASGATASYPAGKLSLVETLGPLEVRILRVTSAK
jgi:hypothetical protein